MIEGASRSTWLLSPRSGVSGKGHSHYPRGIRAFYGQRGGFRLIRILVVDDNPAVRRYLRAILEQQEGWRVSGEARTGGEALHQVLESPPDLVVLDYQMPDLNGVDVAKQISAMFPKIPILMVTLHLSRQLADAAREAGVRGACAKQDIGAVVEAVDLLLHDRTYFPLTPSGL
jgi:DNA-binding NarL/FixJ family response regulator